MDTTLGEIVLVKDLSPGVTEYTRRFSTTSIEAPDSSSPKSLLEFNDQLYFNLGIARSSNDRGRVGSGLYVSDGTEEGTKLVVDIYPDTDDSELGDRYSSIPGLVEFNDKLYFSANNGENGDELYVSDGTAGGTKLVADVNPEVSDDGYPSSSYPRNFVEFNDKLYFTADNSKVGTELYVSDGTAVGTQLLVDINPGLDIAGDYPDNSYPSNFFEFNEKLYFSADNGKNGDELYVSDGTAKGTKLFADLNPGLNDSGLPNISAPSDFVEFNEKLYFSANDGKNGRELYVSDGTADGTQLVADISPGENSYGYGYSSEPSGLVEFNGKLYFSAYGEFGRELYVSDGTAVGTQLLVDINPGENEYGSPASSYPGGFVEFNDKLYFSADNGKNGYELYVSDGTAGGTKLFADIYPGLNEEGSPESSLPSSLTVVGDELFFSASNGEAGTELFKLTLDSEGEDLLCGCSGDDFVAL
jgi:ELWxxDGT repeat protein